MIITDIIIDLLFYTCCGWVGHIVVKIFTLGKVDLDYGDSSEAPIAAYTGAAFLIAISVLVTKLMS